MKRSNVISFDEIEGKLIFLVPKEDINEETKNEEIKFPARAVKLLY